MPLKEGSSEEVIKANIEELIRSGYSRKQAVAIAYRKAGINQDSMKKRAISQDAAGRAEFYTPTQLSENIFATPEGYLVCKDVVIARTGTQEYTTEEIDIQDDGTGVIKVDRPEEEVFNAETIKTFEGKPITVGHPDGFVYPGNWKQHTVGITQNVRRGDGSQRNYLLADMLITDEQAISLVSSGLREVSCGYEADYILDQPGYAHQRNIYGNHVALVDKGRCGGECSIKDEEPTMADKPNAWNRLLATFGVKSADELKQALDKPEANSATGDGHGTTDCGCGTQASGNSATGDASPGNQAILDALNNISEKLDKVAAPTGDAAAVQSGNGTEGKPAGTQDANAGTQADTPPNASAGTQPDTPPNASNKGTQDAQAVIPEAEILVPGFKVQDGDTPQTAQRRALKQAVQGSQAEAVKAFLGDKDPEKFEDSEVKPAFDAAVQLVRQLNNQSGMRSSITTDDFSNPTTIAEINKQNQQFWNQSA